MVELILDCGAHVDPRDDDNNQTPLLQTLCAPLFLHTGNFAQSQGLERQTAIAKLLISRGADIEAVDNNGHAPLHLAVQWANVEITNMLLLKNANVNIKDRVGNTPIHLVLNYNNENTYELVKLLVTLGKDIDLNVRNNNGLTPLKMAKMHSKSEEIVKLLQENGAKE